MSKIDINELINIISKHTNLPKENFNINSKSDDYERWDSLAQTNIIIDLEKKINKKINISKIGELNSVKSILNYLKS